MKARTKMCIFVEHPRGTKGYFFYSPSDNKIFVSTNVTFLEEDYMKNFKPISKVVLEEPLGETIMRQVSHDKTKVLPQGNVTPPINQQPKKPHCSGKVVKQLDKYINLGESI